MPFILLIIALFIALLDWFAVALQIRKLEYLAKPLVMIVILVWLINNGGLTFPLAWFTIGAVFALAGDIALMLPGHKLVTGIAFFGLAYLLYGIGFLSQGMQLNLASLVLLLLVIGVNIEIFRRISAALKPSKDTEKSFVLFGYGAILLWMLGSALLSLTSPGWLAGPAILVSFGAFLLYLSDLLLIWKHSVRPFRMGRIPNIVTYHLGQLMVAYGVVLHLLSI